CTVRHPLPAASRHPPAASRQLPAASCQLHGSLMRVLIVEDEPDLASALQRLLEDAGFSADVAGDGETGLALALEDTYDLLVLDLMLPRLPGEKVVAELRRRGRDLPVLVLTARDLVPDRVRLLD